MMTILYTSYKKEHNYDNNMSRVILLFCLQFQSAPIPAMNFLNVGMDDIQQSRK